MAKPASRRSAPGATTPVRSFWSGTLSFGLVSIPVDLYAAARPRRNAMRLVDKEGHALGHRYVCPADGKLLADDDIVRGFETEDGRLVVVTDREFESAAPQLSRDIALERFVPREQIPPAFFVRPYFLAPDRRAGKAYSLLAQTMERTGKVGIGGFVMRGRDYRVAILSERGVLRAATLRYADELRTPEQVGIAAPSRRSGPSAALVKKLAAVVERHLERRLDLHELEDREAEALHELAARKAEAGRDVVALAGLEEEGQEALPEGGAEVVDLMQVLRRSLGARTTGAPAPAPARPPARKAARRAASPTTAANGAGRDDLARRSKEELARRAAELGIAGRSRMTKPDLVAAIRAAGARGSRSA